MKKRTTGRERARTGAFRDTGGLIGTGQGLAFEPLKDDETSGHCNAPAICSPPFFVHGETVMMGPDVALTMVIRYEEYEQGFDRRCHSRRGRTGRIAPVP